MTLGRSRLLRYGLLAAAAACVAVVFASLRSTAEPAAPERCSPPFGVGRWPSACWRPYSKDSPFNRRVPRTPRLHPESGDIVTRLREWGPVQRLVFGTAGTGRDFGHPIYYAEPNSPVFRVRCIRWRPCEVDGLRGRIPDEARPAAGGDGHMAVVDQRSGWEYDFWKVRRKPRGGGTLVVDHGGRTRIRGTGLGSNATAARFGLLAGIVRPQELEAGRIPHALFVTVRCSSGRSVYPSAPRGTGAPCRRFGEPDPGAPPMGARLWLDMSEREIDRLPVPDWKRTVLRALRRYGGFVGDTMNGNSSLGIMVESGAGYTSFGYEDPWMELAEELDAGTWEGMRVLDLDIDPDWRRHLRILHPCTARGTCR